MKVICAGMSRTGTDEMTKALRHFGLTVYNVEEHLVIHGDAWKAVFLEGQAPDFATMYNDVDAVTSAPSSGFFEEILQAFPEAKVIINVRENESVWAESFMADLRLRQSELSSESFLDRVLWFLSPTFRRNISEARMRDNLAKQIIRYQYCDILPVKGTYLLKKRYREHNDRVRRIVPPDRLLVYSVTQGWGPLCRFLNYQEPAVPFPRETVDRTSKIRKRVYKGNCSSRVIAEASFSLAVLAGFVSISLFAALKRGWK